MTQQERARRTREQILDAAAQEFAEHGYADAVLQTVVQRTGMSKGALYGHFSSKEKLADALVLEGHTVWAALLRDASDAGVLPVDALRALTVNLARALQTDLRLKAALRLLNDGQTPLPEHSGFLFEIRLQTQLLVERAQKTGEVTDAHPARAIAQLLLALVFGAQSRAVLDAREPVDPWIEQVWEIVRRALVDR